jgi:hypothetical protein
VVIIGFIWQLILSPLWGVGENCWAWSAWPTGSRPGWGRNRRRC